VLVQLHAQRDAHIAQTQQHVQSVDVHTDMFTMLEHALTVLHQQPQLVSLDAESALMEQQH